MSKRSSRSRSGRARSPMRPEDGEYASRMRVVVFGATGRTGRFVVEAALSRGLDVTGAARDPEALPSGVRAIEVDARDSASVSTALEGADAVISAMGLPTDSPPTTALSEATATVADAMEHAGVEPFV